jgi:hypothetical protein
MPSSKTQQSKKELFYQFCTLTSPGLLEKGEAWRNEIPGKLVKSGVDLVTLIEQAKVFRKRHRNGVEIKDEIPVKPIGGSKQQAIDYKKTIAELLKKYTGMEFYADVMISCDFYEIVINDVQK